MVLNLIDAAKTVAFVQDGPSQLYVTRVYRKVGLEKRKVTTPKNYRFFENKDVMSSK